jgi:hypothetical protein
MQTLFTHRLVGKRAIIELVTALLPEGTLFTYYCECYDVSLLSCPWGVVNRSHDNL